MNFDGFFYRLGNLISKHPEKKFWNSLRKTGTRRLGDKKRIRFISRRKLFHLFLTKIFVIKIPQSIHGLSNSKNRCRPHCNKLPIISITIMILPLFLYHSINLYHFKSIILHTHHDTPLTMLSNTQLTCVYTK